MAIVHCCLFFFHRQILGGVLNFSLSAFRAFWFCSNKPLDTFIYIHRLQQNYTISLIIRFFADISWWKHFCFFAYGFLTLSLFCVWLRFIFSARMSSCWLVKHLLFIASWNSFMKSTHSVLQLTSDKLSSSSNSS